MNKIEIMKSAGITISKSPADIGKTLFEKNYASIIFKNSKNFGAQVSIKWKNIDLKRI